LNLHNLLSRVIVDLVDTTQFKDLKLQLVPSQASGVDYQINSLFKQAKTLSVAPMQLAEQVATSLQQSKQLTTTFEQCFASKPGFVNLTVSNSYLAKLLVKQLQQPQFEQVLSGETVVIDYSSPNVAKEMHVGHLRGTVIGDCIARLYEKLGACVIRQNHIGDWGTQFGMLIQQIKEQQVAINNLQDLENLYRAAKAKFDSDEQFKKAARETVVALQRGDQTAVNIWQQCVKVSIDHCQALYQRLGIKLKRSDISGESKFNSELPKVVQLLEQSNILQNSDGAKVIFLEQYKTKNDQTQGIIIQKADGGYLYMTSDLAALQYRIATLKASKVLYFVDHRQSLHFQQLFDISEQVGISRGVALKHCHFGSVTDANGKPFKTRSGEVVKLSSLIDEGIERAVQLMQQKNSSVAEQQLVSTAEILAIGSIKFAELSKNRMQDYRFDWEQMLSFDGYTAPYLLYAYTRIQQILKKNIIPIATINTIELSNSFERQLALKILQFEEVLHKIANNCFPHELCQYLYKLANTFAKFYENCPVLSAKDLSLHTRLLLCAATAQVFEQGLEVLGIATIEKM